MQHVYLSPHFDDAIFSCGGLIHKQRTAGEPVAVLTLCAGSPDYDQLSPFAQQYHAAWGDLDDTVAKRRSEDSWVLSKWGVTAYHFNTPDSIYRRADDKIVYPDLSALFAEPDLCELESLPRLWQQKIENLYPKSDRDIIYAPLAAGNHVDHQLARALALRLVGQGWQVWFYEDFPHAENRGALQAAQAWFGHTSWQNKTVPINVNAKIAAIREYRSQIPFTFGDERGMVERVKRFTAERACDVSLMERARLTLAGSGGRRERMWRRVWGYHAHAERIWRQTQCML